MSEQGGGEGPSITFKSTRFGELTVPADSIITIPAGLIGFPRHTKFVMLDHKPPFSWLHSLEDSNLAFVVVDGFEFAEEAKLPPPRGDKSIDLLDNDEYAILVVVTVRNDPKQTTANLKAPVFVNLKNKLGVQIIYDNPNLSTRYPLWREEEKPTEGGAQSQSQPAPANDPKKK